MLILRLASPRLISDGFFSSHVQVLGNINFISYRIYIQEHELYNSHFIDSYSTPISIEMDLLAYLTPSPTDPSSHLLPFATDLVSCAHTLPGLSFESVPCRLQN